MVFKSPPESSPSPPGIEYGHLGKERGKKKPHDVSLCHYPPEEKA